MPGVLPQTKRSQFNRLFLSLHRFNLLPGKKKRKKSHLYGSLRVQVNLLQVSINIGLDGLSTYLSINSNEACSDILTYVFVCETTMHLLQTTVLLLDKYIFLVIYQ